MPFNKAFREMQQELRKKEKLPRQKTPSLISKGSTFPEKDIHCEGMTIHLKGKVDKYGNWIRS